MSQVKTEVGKKNVGTELMARLERMGYQGRIVPVRRVEELRRTYADHQDTGHLDEELSREWLNGFDFQLPERLPQGSVILIAIPQPEQRVTFSLTGRFAGRELTTVMPPTYHHGVDNKVRKVLRDILELNAYQLFDTNLPKKLLAVRSGLAQYGRNNITYVSGMGSYYRLILFASDLPATDDVWQAAQAMEICTRCTACMKSCPTGAISEDRFLLRAELCLTFHNERKMGFPDWIDPDWHHCLVGCLRCQWSCPENKQYINRVADGGTFSAEETLDILGGKSQAELAEHTLAKLRKNYLMDYFEQLPRNLRALLRKEIQNADNSMA
ncbi:4Fe-4S double cluster binding domain-containing protein [Candidatus Neomarinimicrobiota bacterium]